MLKKTDRILKHLYDSCLSNKIDTVSLDSLALNNVPINSAVNIAIDANTRAKIYWFYEYGIMGIAANKFKIVKKTNYGKI
jgi:hypothetical protein